ncbi:MAG: hypothetical protein Q8O28_12520 [Smithellaceae bacterium]|nr:hypothetical protein [Smithellaceae bacterium]
MGILPQQRRWIASSDFGHLADSGADLNSRSRRSHRELSNNPESEEAEGASEKLGGGVQEKVRQKKFRISEQQDAIGLNIFLLTHLTFKKGEIK